MPECPEAVRHVWEWFLEVHAARGSSGFGPMPLTFAELGAWAALTGRDVEPGEVALLRALDDTYVRWWHEQDNRTD